MDDERIGMRQAVTFIGTNRQLQTPVVSSAVNIPQVCSR